MLEFSKKVNEKHNIDKSTTLFIMGDPKNAISTAFGLVNCVENGNFLGKIFIINSLYFELIITSSQ